MTYVEVVAINAYILRTYIQPTWAKMNDKCQHFLLELSTSLIKTYFFLLVEEFPSLQKHIIKVVAPIREQQDSAKRWYYTRKCFSKASSLTALCNKYRRENLHDNGICKKHVNKTTIINCSGFG
jgi:hypothetical protein